MNILGNFSDIKIDVPPEDNCNLIKPDNDVPIKAENKLKIIYSIPISLALVEHSHLNSISY